jgi:hypothetical protein
MQLNEVPLTNLRVVEKSSISNLFPWHSLPITGGYGSLKFVSTMAFNLNGFNNNHLLAAIPLFG